MIFIAFTRRDLHKFDGSAFLKTELLNWFSGSSLLDENNAAGFPGALGSNLTSSLSLNQLEYIVHLPLSSVTMKQVSPVRLAFERIHSLLDFAYTAVKPAFFVVLHLQDPSLQWSPLSHSRNASVTGCRTSLHQLFQIRPYLQFGLDHFGLTTCGRWEKSRVDPPPRRESSQGIQGSCTKGLGCEGEND